MKLYITKLIQTRVPIIWSARIRTDLKPARRRTPAWRIRIREGRKQFLQLLRAIPGLTTPVLPKMEMDPGEPTGKPVVFRRFVSLPPAATKQIKVEGDRI